VFTGKHKKKAKRRQKKCKCEAYMTIICSNWKQIWGHRKAHLLALPVQVEVAILHYFWLYNWRKFQSFHTIGYPLLSSLNSFIFLHVKKLQSKFNTPIGKNN
jgi:hypothetical protein